MTDLQVLQKARDLAVWRRDWRVAFRLGCYAVDMHSGNTTLATQSLDELRNLIGPTALEE